MVAPLISPDPIRWQIAWTAADPSATNTGAAATEGQLILMVGEEDVWPASDFTWTWIELLEWLADSWPWVCGEDGLPSGADVWDFSSVHDLSQALRGAQLPAVVVWREGPVGHILTATGHVRTSWASVKRSLEALGSEIYTRLEPLRGDARAEAARATWERRDSLSMLGNGPR